MEGMFSSGLMGCFQVKLSEFVSLLTKMYVGRSPIQIVHCQNQCRLAKHSIRLHLVPKDLSHTQVHYFLFELIGPHHRMQTLLNTIMRKFIDVLVNLVNQSFIQRDFQRIHDSCPIQGRRERAAAVGSTNGTKRISAGDGGLGSLGRLGGVTGHSLLVSQLSFDNGSQNLNFEPVSQTGGQLQNSLHRSWKRLYPLCKNVHHIFRYLRLEFDPIQITLPSAARRYLWQQALLVQ
mmetsp:Transcript_10432/g.24196  ORF Transcript_10432/g.24196 Transcript_10432/m.24196 type:complete len:234 (-) Transcript_10432:35-736(-)